MLAVDKKLDEVVDSLTSLDKHHHASRFLELLDKVLNALSTDDGLALGFVGQKAVNLGDCAVEGDDGEAVVSHVENEVLAHDGKADEAEISPEASSARAKGN